MNEAEAALHQKLDDVRSAVTKVIRGQGSVVEQLLTAILAEGHVLLEGAPGVAKTLSSRLIAKLIDSKFSRIQFTSDLMPADVLGSSIFNVQKSEFEFHPGPIFADIVLVDEINRAPAKTQSALFEVMEERQVTVDSTCYPMSDIYTIVATQNPIDQEGTYRLPEAQTDRFLFKIRVGYPDAEAEMDVLKAHNENTRMTKLEGVTPILSRDEVMELRRMASKVFVDEKVMKYIVGISQMTRKHPDIYIGASPRASIAFLRASKAYALLQGRTFVIPDDVKAMADAVLCHRISLSAEAEMEGKTVTTVVADVLGKVEVEA